MDNRPCTCHPDEAPVPCMHKYAFNECMEAAMQELVSMLREMAGACRAIVDKHPVGYAQAVQIAMRGSLPGIRAGLGNASKVMVRIVIEKENNDANSVATTAETNAWNSLWIDPSKEGFAE